MSSEVDEIKNGDYIQLRHCNESTLRRFITLMNYRLICYYHLTLTFSSFLDSLKCASRRNLRFSFMDYEASARCRAFFPHREIPAVYRMYAAHARENRF